MVRNVMMILGLGLAVAAFGCDSSSDGNGGSGGTAGNGGMGGEGGTGGSTALMGACTDAADLAMVCPPWQQCLPKLLLSPQLLSQQHQ